ncbi:type II secretion system F family protein [Parvularcula marina]|uniref:type II secretion system F family protein n=1 Tax=Parvularcula marina TaxID=2292771 RepID=UPI0035146A92
MMDIIETITNRQVQIGILAGLAVFATAMTLVAPLFATGDLGKRAKKVADYKERLREQSRADIKASQKKSTSLRTASAKGFAQRMVEQFNLLEVFDANTARKQLIQAGWRGERPLVTYMMARVVTPIIALLVAIFYIYVLEVGGLSSFMKLIASFGALIVGFYLPQLYVSNAVTKRRQKIQLAFPDSLDLMLICVESGMSIEAAMQKVTEEVATTCPELAEEYGLTTAELSYLQDRKIAYANLGERTGLEGVKAVVTALIQSEQYGTPLGQSLRVMAAENRELRMQEAEKKAAALPPKLTVPMILFFLPVLFVVILGPGALIAMGKGEEEGDRAIVQNATDGENSSN